LHNSFAVEITTHLAKPIVAHLENLLNCIGFAKVRKKES
jgi:hypothetical protein